MPALFSLIFFNLNKLAVSLYRMSSEFGNEGNFFITPLASIEISAIIIPGVGVGDRIGSGVGVGDRIGSGVGVGVGEGPLASSMNSITSLFELFFLDLS